MASTPWSSKSKLAGPGSALKITPSSSPVLRPSARSPNKASAYQTTLSLQTVIGTTTATPNGFSSHEPSRSFALCVGSAAILAEIEPDGSVSQRFYRARPTATPVNPVTSFYNQSTSPSTPDNRNRYSSSRLAPGPSPYGTSPGSEWADPSNWRTWSSRERIKAVTSVAISPNGRFLAVGETGYNPRVLIFSTARDASRDVPLTIMTEHSIGVRSLAFSANSQYLATLGDINDGFLFVWAVNLRTGAAKLHSTNKCTSFIRDMCWMGQTLITVGVRHVKVWRLADAASGSPSKSRQNLEPSTTAPSNTPKALSGRNCLLGNLGEQTFTCIASISDTEAIICTDNGALCLLDDRGGAQKLYLVRYVGFSVTSVTLDTDMDMVWLGGRGRRTMKLRVSELRAVAECPSPAPSVSSDVSVSKEKLPTLVSMAFLSTHIVTVDTAREIHVIPVDDFGCDDEISVADSVMPAHRNPVLGVGSLRSPNVLEADFYTWSCDGSVYFWTFQGKYQSAKRVELEQLATGEDDIANELKVVRAVDEAGLFVSGDRYGVLRMLTASPWKCINEVRAHGAEVTDIAVVSVADQHLVASSGRDRMVQLFRKTSDAFELIQTMDDHVGAVGRLLFMNDGARLLSCSADRTIIVREKITREMDGTTVTAYLLSKVITLKISPVSMAAVPDEPDTVVVSTIDRHVQRYDVSSGRHIHSFRASDQESNDAVVMSSLTVTTDIPGQIPRLLVGVATTDKSIRVYDLERDVLLTREFGHSEGVSDVILLPAQDKGSFTLVSTGLDGVVMIWDLSVQPQQTQELSQANLRDEEEETPTKELTATKPPLRRILSRSELAGLRQESPTATPVRDQSPPRLQKKTSRYSLTPTSTRNGTISRGDSPPPGAKTPINRRSPSPSTKTKTLHRLTGRSSTSSLRRSSADFRNRGRHSPATKSSSEFGSLNMSTEQVCRTLRAYRKKLNTSTDYPRGAKDLERELHLTSHALTERGKRQHQSLTTSGDTETESGGSSSSSTGTGTGTGTVTGRGKRESMMMKLTGRRASNIPTITNNSPTATTATPNGSADSGETTGTLRKRNTPASVANKPSRIARRVPSTPLLSRPRNERWVSRSRSVDGGGDSA